MRKRIRYVVFTLCVLALAACTAEVLTRLFFPRINPQDTQHSLFRSNAFGATMGWKPGARGISFGVQVEIDASGFRKMAFPARYRESWLVLGDSITFGVGVQTRDTFVQLLQNDHTEARLWNTSVAGYSLPNYKDVLEHFLESRTDITRVLLFYSLNDLYGNLQVLPPDRGFSQRVLALLRRRSRFYLLVKNALTDRSKAYFSYDAKAYDESNPVFTAYMEELSRMRQSLAARRIDFTVILLPYEYQLRVRSEDVLKPQRLMKAFFEAEGIAFVDAYPYLEARREASRALFLFADGMHLSRSGHRAVYEMLRDCFPDNTP